MGGTRIFPLQFSDNTARNLLNKPANCIAEEEWFRCREDRADGFEQIRIWSNSQSARRAYCLGSSPQPICAVAAGKSYTPAAVLAIRNSKEQKRAVLCFGSRKCESKERKWRYLCFRLQRCLIVLCGIFRGATSLEYTVSGDCRSSAAGGSVLTRFFIWNRFQRNQWRDSVAHFGKVIVPSCLTGPFLSGYIEKRTAF